MQLPVVLAAVLAASWLQGGEANKCNKTFIGLIKTFNEEVITGILKTNIELSPDYVAYTTLDYFSNEKDVSSIVTSWSKEGNYTSTFYFKNKDTVPVYAHGGPLEEKDGYTYDKATETYRFHVCAKGLVSGFYKCQENGKEGPPEALVKVWKGYQTEDLEKAKENIEMLLGYELSAKFEVV